MSVRNQKNVCDTVVANNVCIGCGIFAVTCYGLAMNGDDRRFLGSQLRRSLRRASGGNG